MITIPVDTNSLVRDGLVLASSRRASGPLHVGDTVCAQDVASETEFPAIVRNLDGKRVYLEVNWDGFESPRDVELHGAYLRWSLSAERLDYLSHTKVWQSTIAWTSSFPHPGAGEITQSDLARTA